MRTGDMSSQVFRLELRQPSGTSKRKPYTPKPKEQPPATKTSPLYFWRPDAADTGFLCMWFPSPFQDIDDPSKIYPTAEHYLLHHRALLFGDEAIAADILATGSPHRAKELVKRVKNFDVEVWHANRERIAADANWYKFTCPLLEPDDPALPPGCPWLDLRESSKLQAKDLKKALLETGEHQIILGHPMDRYWGIGQAKGRAWPRRETWGQNRMGICLMELREMLRIEEGDL
ncbi:DUF1768-domain-containing protein [Hypoxylon sp. FL0890]|nr:DUF1768-domain-containing protein [Hypoxylon sp. FL0890]